MTLPYAVSLPPPPCDGPHARSGKHEQAVQPPETKASGPQSMDRFHLHPDLGDRSKSGRRDTCKVTQPRGCAKDEVVSVIQEQQSCRRLPYANQRGMQPCWEQLEGSSSTASSAKLGCSPQQPQRGTTWGQTRGGARPK